MRPVRFGSRGPSELLISYRNALTEKAWEVAIQRIGKLRGEQLASKVYDCIGNNEHRFHIVSLSIIPKKKQTKMARQRRSDHDLKKRKK